VARLGRGQPNRPIIVRTVAGDRGGSATITGTLTLTGSGVKDAAGAASITGAAALTASGTRSASGGSEVTATVTLAGSGTKATGIGAPPRPRINWQFIVGPASGGHTLALTEARGRRYTARLTASSDASFTLDGRHPQALAVDELATDLHILWTAPGGTATQILDRMRMGQSGDTLEEADHRFEVAALDYREVLNRRLLYSTDTLTYAATDQAEIAWGLVDSTQGNLGGNLGISKGWSGTTPTGINRDRTYEAGDFVGARIQELSEVIDGFDWDVAPISASALELQTFFPQRGVDRGVVLIFGGLVAKARREVNPADYANAIRYTGSSDPATTAQELEAADLVSRPEGRWDAVFGDDGLITQQALNDRAAWQLAQSETLTPVWTLTLKQGAWEGPDHIWLGDPVRLIVKSGRLDVDTTLRVFELEFAIGENGEETVQVTLGGPRPDYRRLPAVQNRRLTNLERR